MSAERPAAKAQLQSYLQKMSRATGAKARIIDGFVESGAGTNAPDRAQQDRCRKVSKADQEDGCCEPIWKCALQQSGQYRLSVMSQPDRNVKFELAYDQVEANITHIHPKGIHTLEWLQLLQAAGRCLVRIAQQACSEAR